MIIRTQALSVLRAQASTCSFLLCDPRRLPQLQPSHQQSNRKAEGGEGQVVPIPLRTPQKLNFPFVGTPWRIPLGFLNISHWLQPSHMTVLPYKGAGPCRLFPEFLSSQMTVRGSAAEKKEKPSGENKPFLNKLEITWGQRCLH